MGKKRQEVELVWRRIDRIPPHPDNPKQHDVPGIMASIERFGFRGAIVFNGRRVTSEGHGRTEALLKLYERDADTVPDGIRPGGKRDGGMWLAPCLVGMTFKNADEEMTFLATANQLTIAGGWDDQALHKLLARTRATEDAFVGTGFIEADLAKLTRQLEREAGEHASTAGDVPPPAPPSKPTTKLGDVWRLGTHRLLCGSCVDLARILPKGRLGDLLVTDPPYGVDYTSIGRRLKKERTGVDTTHANIANDALPPAEMQAVWTEWFTAIRACLRKGAAYYVTGPAREPLLHLMLAMRDAGLPYRHQLVWDKGRIVMGRTDYHYEHEPILYGWAPGAARHPVCNRSETTVWRIERPTVSEHHPTMKPVLLYERAMENSSKVGDVCLEPFAGSGTAYLAAENVRRKVYGSELSPGYCDVIVQRWQEATGKKATRAKKS